jgi:outer membrane receptor for ferric coprogen and ferric-rhodotorulic acid
MLYSRHAIGHAIALLVMGCMATSVLAQSAQTAQAARTAEAANPAGVGASDTRDSDASLPTVRVTATGGDGGKRSYSARRSDTATGLDLARRDTPQSISVITQQQIDDFGLYSVNDMLSLATGVTVERVETDRTYYTSRGFDVTNFQFDGIGMPFTGGNMQGDIDMALFERVDILRGANGLLSGTGNPSATINFVSKRPTKDLKASAGLTLGSWNNRRADGDISGALNASGSVRARLILVDESKDSYLDRYHSTKQVASGMVDVDLTPDTLLSLGYTEQRKNADSPLWGALPLYYSDGSPTSYDVSASTSTDWAYWNNTDRRAQASLTQALGGDWLLKATVMQRELTSDSALYYVYGAPVRGTDTGLYRYPSTFDGHYTQSMADVRVSGPFSLAGRQHELLAGLSWAHEKALEYSGYGRGRFDAVPTSVVLDGSDVKPLFDDGADGSGFNTTRRSAYAASHLNVLDGLKVIVGANATQATTHGENYGVAHDYDRGAVTPYLGTVVDLSRNVSAYASYTRIFNPQTAVDANLQILAPIQGRNVEAGVKSEWLDKKLAATLAVFRTRQDNTAEVAGTYGILNYYKGVNATSTGVEAELTGRLMPGWNINAGYTQLQIKDQDGKEARTYVPRSTLRAATDYLLLPQLRVGAALRYQSDVANLDGTVQLEQKAYALLDLMARYEFTRNLSLAVNLNNATNKKYLSSLYWTQAYYGAPRNVSATLRWAY